MALAVHPDFAPRAAINPERPVSVLLWLTIFSGSFVLFEPAPYEGLFALLACAVLIRGVRFATVLVFPLAFLTLWIAGGIISVAANGLNKDTALYVAISAFLAFTTILVAALLAEHPERHIRTIRSAYIATALLSALLAIAGYFHLVPGADTFLFYTRAKALFQDPNVFAPFLILPALLLFQDVLMSSSRRPVLSGGMLLVLIMAILLSFSRASWGHLILSSMVMIALMFATSGSNLLRLRIFGLGLFGVFAGAAAIAALLTIPSVSEVFLQRFTVTQDYDAGETGRFGAQLRSLQFLLEAPFGFGPYGFGVRFGQDSHNVYLNSFASYGWLGGIAYICFVISTFAAGARCVLIRTPWQNFHIAAFAAYFGASLEGVVIDTDHWRHYFLLAGLVWGLSAATMAYRRRCRARLRGETAAARI